jgi:hypothetical protein
MVSRGPPYLIIDTIFIAKHLNVLLFPTSTGRKMTKEAPNPTEKVQASTQSPGLS